MFIFAEKHIDRLPLLELLVLDNVDIENHNCILEDFSGVFL